MRGSVKFQNAMTHPIGKLKSRDFDKHMALPYVPSGHFALGTLSETCFKYSVFDVNAGQKKIIKSSKHQTCRF